MGDFLAVVFLLAFPLAGAPLPPLGAVGAVSTAVAASGRSGPVPSLNGLPDPRHRRLPVRSADSIFNHAAKAIEIEDIEARVSELERAAEAQKKKP